MDATQNARPFSRSSLRRYVLDSLAVGHSISIQTGNSNLAAGLLAFGNQMGAKISVRNSTDPANSWIIHLESDLGAAHFDLYTMH